MSEKLGEIARESSDYRCERCHQVTRIARGMLIPACPNCGYGSYDISNPRFETKDGQLGPHEQAELESLAGRGTADIEL